VNSEELRKSLAPTSPYGKGEWIDMAGLLVPNERVMTLLDDLENDNIPDLNELNRRYESLHVNYFDYTWNWCLDVFKQEFGLDLQNVEIDQLLDFIDDWKKSVIDLDNMLYADARKEFTLNNQTGFGIDGSEETRTLDFEQVRGEFESHPSVQDIRNHIREKSRLAEDLKERLILCKKRDKP
jgi:hypothetical protein